MVAKDIIWIKEKEDKKELPNYCELPNDILFNIYDVYDYLTQKYHYKIKKLTLVVED